MKSFSMISESPERSFEIAVEFASRLKPGQLVALTGELGAGKTVFAKGLCHGLGCQQVVSSPSFTLVNIYQGKIAINHLDCYRLGHPEEIIDLGPNELFYPEGVTIVEWAEKVRNYLPKEIWVVGIAILDEHTRRLDFFWGEWPDQNQLSLPSDKGYI